LIVSIAKTEKNDKKTIIVLGLISDPDQMGFMFVTTEYQSHETLDEVSKLLGKLYWYNIPVCLMQLPARQGQL
jgi:hypothetical protein